MGDLVDLDAEVCRPEEPPQTARGGAERCGARRLGVRPGCAGERERTFPTSTYLSRILLSSTPSRMRERRSCDEPPLTLGRVLGSVPPRNQSSRFRFWLRLLDAAASGAVRRRGRGSSVAFRDPGREAPCCPFRRDRFASASRSVRGACRSSSLPRSQPSRWPAPGRAGVRQNDIGRPGSRSTGGEPRHCRGGRRAGRRPGALMSF